MRTFSKIAIIVAAGALMATGVAGAASNDNPDNPPAPSAQAATNAPGVIVSTEFVPLNPCRAIDTRESSAGYMTSNSARTFRISGSSGFIAQGGKSGGCGVPSGAKAVALSMTTTNSVGQGRLTAYPAGSSLPNATSLTYYPDTKISGQVTVKLSNDGRVTVSNISTQRTDMVGDVVGYYIDPIAANVSSSGTLTAASPQITGVTKQAVGTYWVTTNTSTYDCVGNATAQNSGLNAAVYTYYSGGFYVYLAYGNGTYGDSSFFVTITC